jgi:uncharacterized membrane protein (UPF0127 family)
MKKVLLVLAGIALIVALVSTYAPRQRSVSTNAEKTVPVKSTPAPVFPYADRQIITFKVGAQILRVEVVTTPESITLGLSGREKIGSDGMLFVFSESYVPRFWMKEMRFALDFIWIDHGTVVDITENVPPPKPGQTLSDLPLYSPEVLVNQVLEVPAGSVAQWKVKKGDIVTLQP